MKKDSAVSYRIDSDSFGQWTFPVGVKFDWARSATKSGWSLKPSVEVAYVRAAGDLDYRSRIVRNGVAGGSYFTAVTDADNFRVSVNVEATRKDFTLGLNLRGQWGSNQRDLGASLSGRWEF